MTINKAFKDVYNEFLSDQGYTYCSKLQRFIKVLNKELIFFIGLKKVSPSWKQNKAFTINAGIVSVYFSECSKWTFNYNGHDIQNFSPEYKYGMGFEYNEDSMMELVEESARLTKELILPVLNNVTDLKSYVDYAMDYSEITLSDCNKFAYDSLTLILTDNHEDFMDRVTITNENEREFVTECVNEIYNAPRDEVYANEELLQAAYAEAKKRKKENLEKLQEFLGGRSIL